MGSSPISVEVLQGAKTTLLSLELDLFSLSRLYLLFPHESAGNRTFYVSSVCAFFEWVFANSRFDAGKVVIECTC